MSGFYVLAVPEFASLIDAAVKSGAGKVHPQRGHYQFVEFESNSSSMPTVLLLHGPRAARPAYGTPTRARSGLDRAAVPPD